MQIYLMQTKFRVFRHNIMQFEVNLGDGMLLCDIEYITSTPEVQVY